MTKATFRLSGEAARKAQARLALTAPKGAVVPSPKPEKPKPSKPDPKKADKEARHQAMLAQIEAARALHSDLAQAFPTAFAPPDHGAICPLKIGIHRDLAERLPEVSKQAIGTFLKSYSRTPDYRALLVAGAPRLDLDGRPAGCVTEAAAQLALEPQARRRHDQSSPIKKTDE